MLYRRVRPTNDFEQFERAEVEQSIPDRFEKQVARYTDRIAVKTRTLAVTYDALNRSANCVPRAILA